MLFMKGTPSAPQCGFSRQLVSILRENQVKYGYGGIQYILDALTLSNLPN